MDTKLTAVPIEELFANHPNYQAEADACLAKARELSEHAAELRRYLAWRQRGAVPPNQSENPVQRPNGSAGVEGEG